MLKELCEKVVEVTRVSDRVLTCEDVLRRIILYVLKT